MIEEDIENFAFIAINIMRRGNIPKKLIVSIPRSIVTESIHGYTITPPIC